MMKRLLKVTLGVIGGAILGLLCAVALGWVVLFVLGGIALSSIIAFIFWFYKKL